MKQKTIKNKKMLIMAISLFLFTITVISFISYEKTRKETLFSTYATIDETKISNLEYIYFYQNFRSNIIETYGSYFSTLEIPEGETIEQQIQDKEENTTWGDYFIQYSFQELLKTNLLYEASILDKYVVEDLDELVAEKLESLKNTALNKNINYKKYLSETFIEGTKEKDLIPIIEKIIIAEKYETYYIQNMTISQEEIEEYYNNNKEDYDMVDYRIFSFSVYDEYISILNKKAASSIDDNEYNNVEDEESSEVTLETILQTEEYHQAKENVLQKATDFYNQVYDEETFKKLCVEYAINEDAKKLYEEKDYSLNTGRLYKETNESIRDWLYDETKQEKSTVIIYDENSLSYKVVYFINRYKNEGEFVSVKNIFIPFESSDLVTLLITEEDKEKAKEQTNLLLSEWENSQKTNTVFDELAIKYSKDLNNINYSNLTQEKMPVAFAEWAYSSERKSGDYFLTNDDNGYYFVYFDKTSEDILSYEIRNIIADEKFVEFIKELVNTHKIEIISQNNVK